MSDIGGSHVVEVEMNEKRHDEGNSGRNLGKSGRSLPIPPRKLLSLADTDSMVRTRLNENLVNHWKQCLDEFHNAATDDNILVGGRAITPDAKEIFVSEEELFEFREQMARSQLLKLVGAKTSLRQFSRGSLAASQLVPPIGIFKARVVRNYTRMNEHMLSARAGEKVEIAIECHCMYCKLNDKENKIANPIDSKNNVLDKKTQCSSRPTFERIESPKLGMPKCLGHLSSYGKGGLKHEMSRGRYRVKILRANGVHEIGLLPMHVVELSDNRDSDRMATFVNALTQGRHVVQADNDTDIFNAIKNVREKVDTDFSGSLEMSERGLALYVTLKQAFLSTPAERNLDETVSSNMFPSIKNFSLSYEQQEHFLQALSEMINKLLGWVYTEPPEITRLVNGRSIRVRSADDSVLIPALLYTVVCSMCIDRWRYTSWVLDKNSSVSADGKLPTGSLSHSWANAKAARAKLDRTFCGVENDVVDKTFVTLQHYFTNSTFGYSLNALYPALEARVHELADENSRLYQADPLTCKPLLISAFFFIWSPIVIPFRIFGDFRLLKVN
jgi:hypothetical protein